MKLELEMSDSLAPYWNDPEIRSHTLKALEAALRVSLFRGSLPAAMCGALCEAFIDSIRKLEQQGVSHGA